MASVGHTGSHAAQEMQSSKIFNAMENSPYNDNEVRFFYDFGKVTIR
jgi:hypothetical protein